MDWGTGVHLDWLLHNIMSANKLFISSSMLLQLGQTAL
jgi:hypothetical protein